jgi:hypothetical protein
MHDDRAREVVELGAQLGFEEGLLQAKILVPDDAFKEGVEQADNQGRGDALGQELGALGDAARDDGWHGRCEGAQEEEPHQREALPVVALGAAADGLGIEEERHPIGDGETDEKVGDCGNGEVDQDLAQRVDLVLVPDGAGFQEGKAAVHGKHQHRADQQEEHICARLKPCQALLNILHASPGDMLVYCLGDNRGRDVTA